MPQIFRIGSYIVYFWSNEGEPIDPIHAMGIPDVYIMQRGGWTTDNVMKTVYRHTLSDKNIEMNNKANNYFSELCNTKCNTKTKNP